jgi:protein SCO1
MLFTNYLAKKKRAFCNLNKLICISVMTLIWGLMLTACSPDVKNITYQGIDITGNNQFSSDFHLLDLNQKPLHLKTTIEKSQKNSLLIFGYTACPDYCPSTLTKIVEVKNILKSKNIDVTKDFNIFFVSVDANRDKPSILKKYLAAFDDQIIGLIASGHDLEQLKKNFKIAVETQDNLINHTTGLYMIDQKGSPRLYLPYNLNPEQIANDMINLLKQQ